MGLPFLPKCGEREDDLMVSAQIANQYGYYSTHGAITEPGVYSDLLEALPSGIDEICEVIQGLLVHYDVAHLYGIDISSQRREHRELRHVSKILACMQALDDRPLTIPRPPNKRLVINCRDYATMLCAILRHKGVPARARCGFAKYFSGPSSRKGFSV